MFFIYNPPRILLGSAFWCSVSAWSIYFMLHHAHRPAPLILMGTALAVFAFSAWVGATAVLFMARGVSTFLGAWKRP